MAHRVARALALVCRARGGGGGGGVGGGGLTRRCRRAHADRRSGARRVRRLLALLLIAACCAASWPAALRPYAFTFPRDHGSHRGDRLEWWYVTGHLLAADGHRYGFELTLFRVGIVPGAPSPRPGESRWRNGEIFPAHFAVSDDTAGRFLYAERLARPALDQAGASSDGLDVHAGDWWIRGLEPLRLHAQTRAAAISLRLRSLKPPAVHGQDGISRKGACAGCASHYYSLTRLSGEGSVRVGTQRRAVRALAWLDHEFGSGDLDAGVVGWDWFAMQLADGRDVMLYHLRRRDGSFIPASSGSLIGRDGSVEHLRAADFSIQATGAWRSPQSRARYPSGWIVRVPRAGVDVRVVPRLRDQELVSRGVSYWEGDVCLVPLSAPADGAARRACGAGQGYVELTGYAGEVPR
ncbi:carotenoid 1,2-hydratase [bacterium]|nr:MAG: carotenoid 1,2-hydratase [bacterium]